MMKSYLKALTAAGIAALLPVKVEAISLGEYEYSNSCAQCDGASGKGDGPVAPFLTKNPSNLTMLQKNNGGIFPVTNAYSIIEGSADVGVHGPRDMPLWGNRFRARIKYDENEGFSPEDTDEYVTARILALIEYLSTIQAE